MQDNAGVKQIRLTVRLDGDLWANSAWYTLGSGWHAAEIEWRASAVDGTPTGYMTLWLDGVKQGSMTLLDNDTYVIDSVLFGAIGVDPGTSGSIAFDDFEARRFSYIGLLPDPGIPDPESVAEPSWLMASYNYTGDQPHAVTSVAREQADSTIITDTYQYDANGNMTCRVEGGVTFVQEYNAENRIAQVRQVDGDCTDAFEANDPQVWTFTYDGDGVRVMEVFSITNGTTQVPQTTKHYFAGGAYEVEVDHTNADAVSTKKYYSIAGMRVAMDDGTGLYYFASDLNSSTTLVLDATGLRVSEQRYLPFGEARADVGIQLSEDDTGFTDFGYTGQRNLSGMGLMDYNARFYSPLLGRFTQPDTIVPSPSDPQTWNRYSYALNDPIYYSDPSGHCPICIGAVIGAAAGALISGITQTYQAMQGEDGKTFAEAVGSIDGKQVAMAAGAGAVAGLTFGLGAAAGTAIVGATSIAAGSTAATAAGIATVAISSAAAGQTARATQNFFNGEDITEGLFDPKEMLLDATIGVVTFGLATKLTTGRFFDYQSAVGLKPGGTVSEGCSFDAETPVVTVEGLVAIGDIEVGMYVLAYNEDREQVGYYQVTDVWSHEDSAIVYLTIDGETIETTPEHPFFTGEERWVSAGDLKVGDLIFSADGSFEEVEMVYILEEVQVMYNLTVSQAHTFFVGNGQWLVHNACDLDQLNRKLASEQQMGEPGETMFGKGSNRPFNDASKWADDFGGDANSFAKKTSSSYKEPDGFQFETHWVEDTATGMRYGFKTILVHLRKIIEGQ